MSHIAFNKPFLTGKETWYIEQAVTNGKISGNGVYSKKCQSFFEENYGFEKALMTTSCTDALEMSAILLGITEGDEVIMPSYTFVSTANAFVLRGAKIIFADSKADHPNIDETKIESLITAKTKAIVVVHYAGVACEMDTITKLAEKYGLYVVEDAAQAIDSYYKGKPLGSIGHMSTFSFHETKNIQCGEGGMLAINDTQFVERAEIIWEKGTNRAAFFRGEIDKYGWVDIGSSFLCSDLNSAFLWAQLEELTKIQEKRKDLWSYYYKELHPLSKKGSFKLPEIPSFGTNNAHMFYLVCTTKEERVKLISFLKSFHINAVFHYQSLHKSEYYTEKHSGRDLPMSDLYSDNLVRLPFFYELLRVDQDRVISKIKEFYA
jgi:dTDP-4-amino-4,6-dideoxygalactose transaminase